MTIEIIGYILDVIAGFIICLVIYYGFKQLNAGVSMSVEQKDELQKKYDELNGKIDALLYNREYRSYGKSTDIYFDINNGNYNLSYANDGMTELAELLKIDLKAVLKILYARQERAGKFITILRENGCNELEMIYALSYLLAASYPECAHEYDDGDDYCNKCNEEHGTIDIDRMEARKRVHDRCTNVCEQEHGEDSCGQCPHNQDPEMEKE